MKNVLLAIVLYGGSIILLLYLSQKIHPTSSLFPLERLDESLQLLITFSPQAKTQYYNSLVEKRFSDVVYLISTQQTDILLEVSLRYATTVGKAVQVETSYHQNISQLKLILIQEKEGLQKMIKNYTLPDQRQKYLIDDMNYITTYEQRL